MIDRILMTRLSRVFVSIALAICFALTSQPASADDPQPQIGEAASLPAPDEADVLPAYTGCTRVDTSSINAGYEQLVVELVNQYRAAAGLPPLKRNANLDFASRYHARDMMSDDYFSHDSLDRQNNSLVTACAWSTRIKNYYLNREYLAENIAAGHSKPEDVVASWMASDGHRANILNPNLREIGVGFMQTGGTYQRYWVQDLGSAQNVYPLIINREAAITRNLTVNLFIYGQGIWDEMRLRNDSGAWTSWQSFQQSRTWTLSSGIGTHTVSVEMRKRDGSASTASSDSIIVNGSLPYGAFLPVVKRK
jgi:uncharacterized protein YkwD